MLAVRSATCLKCVALTIHYLLQRCFIEKYFLVQRCILVCFFVAGAVPGESIGGTDVDPDASEVTNVVISNLGGTGTYMDVVSMAAGANMICPDEEAACVQEVSPSANQRLKRSRGPI